MFVAIQVSVVKSQVSKFRNQRNQPLFSNRTSHEISAAYCISQALDTDNLYHRRRRNPCCRRRVTGGAGIHQLKDNMFK